MKLRIFKTILLAYALICLCIPLLSAQEEKIQYKVEVKEKLLYVLALDKKGNPVTDLKKEDFQLFVDSEPQKIDTFYLINHTIEKERAKKKGIPADKFEVSDISIKETKPEKRFILAVIPNQYISFFQRNSTEKALQHLIEQVRYPDDWIGLVVIHRDWIFSLQDFTCSEEKLIQKVNAYFKFDRKKLSLLQRQCSLTDEEFYKVPQLPIFQGVIPVQGGIDIIPALKLIGEKMGVLKGRKIIFAFGLDLLFTAPEYLNLYTYKQYNNRIYQFFKMIDEMQSHNITIYYSEFRGPRASGFADAYSDMKLDSILLPGSTIYAPEKRAYINFLHESSHFALANETGGKYYYNISSPTYFIDDVNKMNSSYYLISFPITIQLNKKKSLSIKLRCKREGVKLYYSNKYYAPHDLEEKKFEDTYKKIQLFKYLVVDTEQPELAIEGQWIPLPREEKDLQAGFIDFYLPSELFQQLPVTYQLGGSYATPQRRGIFFQGEAEFSSSQKDKGYRARALVKLTGEGKSLRLVAMDSESGEYGRFDIDISKPSGKTDFSDILLGKLVDKKRIQEFRDYSEAQYNPDKDFYKLLSLDKKLIIPSANNTFSQGEKITFCLIHKIPGEQAKRYKHNKAMAYLAPDREGQVTEIKIPVHIKKVKKYYLQYYGTIDPSKSEAGRYRLEININGPHNLPIAAFDTYFKIIP